MRQLLLLRHAKSSRDDPKQPDRERPLSPRGHRAAGVMRRCMRELGLLPDLVLVSTARRTMETLEALEPWDETPLIEPMDSLYLASATQLLTTLHGVGEVVRSVLVIAHNPGLHELALALVGPPPIGETSETARRLAAGFPTGALAEFIVPARWWELDVGGARLQRFLMPREQEAD